MNQGPNLLAIPLTIATVLNETESFTEHAEQDSQSSVESTLVPDPLASKQAMLAQSCVAATPTGLSLNHSRRFSRNILGVTI